ncbi:docking protein 3 [Monodelphis domestica]|uniref:Docking protein 3 n=1 Tax=Monodelphis domestica TaxID=13616 RepID=F6U708_MONDO|nr:docking protein 3 [Monodelphis domestica]
MDTQETALKDGLLYQQHAKFGKKSWRKVWAFLYADGPSGVARLESWDVRDGGGGPAGDKPTGRRGERRVIRLADCVSVLPAEGESCPRDTTAFLLMTTERSHVLAAQDRHTWMAHICHLAFPSMNGISSGSGEFGPALPGLVPMEENSIYSSWQEMGEFSVVVQKTEAATRCQLKGPYLLVTGQDGIYLSEPTAPQPLFVWPYHFLRKFGSDKGVFSFEAGRRCDSGEGLFAFSCPRASEICSAVGAAIIAHQREHRAELPGPAASRPCPLSRASSLPSLEPMGELREAPLGLEAWGGQPSNGKTRLVLEAGPQSLPPCLGTSVPDGPSLSGPSGSVLYASISKWSSGLPRTAPDPASALTSAPAPKPVAEHLYENLCTSEDGIEPRGESLLQASHGGHLDSHIYDNSVSWPGPHTTTESSLEAQYRRLLELDLNEEGAEEAEDNGPGRLLGHSGFKAKLVTLLSRERKKGPVQRNQGLGPAEGQA